MFSESLNDTLLFVLAQQAMVHEDASQLVTDCLVQQGCRDRRINATRETADDSIVAHLLPDLLNQLLDQVAKLPTARTSANIDQEV